MQKLFVYGTLRKENRNHYYLKEATCTWNQCWVNGSLYDTGLGFPVLIQKELQGKIYGELYEVTSEQLEQIDQLEEYVENEPNNLYERKSITVTNDKGVKTEALVFYGGRNLINSEDLIESGDWNVHTYLQKEHFLYFAYGSCMDNERFTLQGVNHHFEKVLGCGLLENYELKFSRNSSDGGKADIVENHDEKVEGKVYQVPLDAVNYLYKREGVFADAYRPIIVTILLNGESKRTITFIGTEKEAETRPTNKYATEILRGGEGYLSATYFDRLQKKINGLLNEV